MTIIIVVTQKMCYVDAIFFITTNFPAWEIESEWEQNQEICFISFKLDSLKQVHCLKLEKNPISALLMTK